MTVRTRLVRSDESFTMEQSACQDSCKVHLAYSLGSTARFGSGSSREKPRWRRGTDSGWWYPDRPGTTINRGQGTVAFTRQRNVRPPMNQADLFPGPLSQTREASSDHVLARFFQRT